MDLYLIRHGNTFDPGDKVVWAGSRNDLPLVKKGFEQAGAAAKWLADNNIAPAAVYCGPLSRTRTFASIIGSFVLPGEPALSLSKGDVTVDPRLDELDYGEWSGLTDAEVAERFGEDALIAWRDKGTWPADGNWGKSEAEVVEETRSFLLNMSQRFSHDESIVAVTSNGRLKYFLKACRHNVPFGEISVKTGRICLVRSRERSQFEAVFWNRNPGE